MALYPLIFCSLQTFLYFMIYIIVLYTSDYIAFTNFI